MYSMGRGGARRSVNIWPGFVDGLASLLLVVIFVLMVFMVAQFFLSVALSGRDAALQKLEREVSQLADLLSLERQENADLRTQSSDLSAQLSSSLAARDTLQNQLAALNDERDGLTSQLEQSVSRRDSLENQLADLTRDYDEAQVKQDSLSNQLAAMIEQRDSLTTTLSEREAEAAALLEQQRKLQDEQQQLKSQQSDLEKQQAELQGQNEDLVKRLGLSAEEIARSAEELKTAYSTIEADKETIETQLAELAALKKLREEEEAKAAAALASKAAELEDAFKSIEADKEKIEAQLAELALLKRLREEEAALAKTQLEDAYTTIEADRETIETQLAELALLQQMRDELTAGLASTEETVAAQEELTEKAQAEVVLLNRQIAALRQQLARIAVTLEATEAKNLEQEVQIADLGSRLNVALASKVQELARYRSEFFGRLREVLGNRRDVRVVGDRFVFQSEVLFSSGAAELEEAGKGQLASLAKTLREISRNIPPEVDWVLRVDGHTDRAPINTFAFPSNWELSTARAISVVKFLNAQGIPANRLAATGFGEFQPIDEGNDEIAYRRNRRIELKLTQR
ncbi:peptidoglycan -binding protein [Pelagibius sp. Alg239-R121]|uniref:peptidoglycan -binding protein n=1 Tax=Pelagibius sp. Alg239-R121 TaxID=2993448 RepID=UPI0024A789E7|nr:peptidoglycan -binding protein [Pelagibius sp. Alg239-R121]